MSTSMSSTLQLETMEPESRQRSTQSPPTSAGSSLVAGIANLLNTVVGAGILSLPYAFRSSGLAVGVAYQYIFGGASWYGSWLLLDALRSCPSCMSYEELASATLGRAGATAYNTASLINCYGACVSYLVVAGDILPPLLHESGIGIGRPAVLTALTLVLILPLSALRDISALQYASGLSICIYLLFVLTMLALASDSSAPPRELPALVQPDAGGWIRAIPLCAFAYLHQTSLFPIIQELRGPSPGRLRVLVGASVGTAIVLYTLTGLAACVRFGSTVEGDVLLNLATVDSAAVRIMRLGFGVSVCLTYPCLHYAARRSLDQLTFGRVGQQTPHRRLLALTAALVGSSLGVALVVRRVELIFGFTGAIASTMISYILPAAIHLMARPHRVLDLRKNWASLGFLVGGGLCGATALINHALDVAVGA